MMLRFDTQKCASGSFDIFVKILSDVPLFEGSLHTFPTIIVHNFNG